MTKKSAPFPVTILKPTVAEGVFRDQDNKPVMVEPDHDPQSGAAAPTRVVSPDELAQRLPIEVTVPLNEEFKQHDAPIFGGDIERGPLPPL